MLVSEKNTYKMIIKELELLIVKIDSLYSATNSSVFQHNKEMCYYSSGSVCSLFAVLNLGLVKDLNLVDIISFNKQGILNILEYCRRRYREI